MLQESSMTYEIKGDKIIICKSGVYFSVTPEQATELARLLYDARIDQIRQGVVS